MTRRREAVFVWACVALVVAVSGGLLALGGCGEGTAGQVCEQPNAADCDSHTGGERHPSTRLPNGSPETDHDPIPERLAARDGVTTNSEVTP